MVSDADLVIRAQRGEKSALGQLVERYQDRIFNTCYRMCHNHADALDLTQAAFLRAWQALPAFESKANFFTWLFRIAMNGAISQRRRRRRETGSLEESMSPLERLAPEREIERMEARTEIEKALDELDDDFRAAVVLKDVEDLNYAQISEVLGLPLGTVKSRIHRGRQMLREKLSGLRQEHEPR